MRRRWVGRDCRRGSFARRKPDCPGTSDDRRLERQECLPANVTRQPIIHVASVRKTYGRTIAVDHVSFDVQLGEIFGLIGPNGAGKTTTMECVEGLRTPDRGLIRVLGLDPRRDVYALQERIGVQLQEAQLQKRIKLREAVGLWSSLYRKRVDGDRLIEQLGLGDKRDAWFMTLSGGQKQRLFIALALINNPELLFLDELTTGLDPQARRAIWDLVRGIRQRGKTVFLTTHLRGIWHGEGWSAHVGDVKVLSGMFLAFTAVSTRVFRWE